MSWNKNSGYGQGMFAMISSVVPAFGNIHIVLSSSDTSLRKYSRLQDIMDIDND